MSRKPLQHSCQVGDWREHTDSESFLQKLRRIQLTVLCFALAAGWGTLYYLGGPDPVSRMSFRVADPSWVPAGFVQEPLIGNHFFGDLQLLIAWGSNSTPYELDLPAQHLATAQAILKVVSLLPMRTIFIFYLAISVGLLWFAFRSVHDASCRPKS